MYVNVVSLKIHGDTVLAFSGGTFQLLSGIFTLLASLLLLSGDITK